MRKLLIALALVATLITGGCSKPFSGAPLGVELVVRAAAARVLHENPSWVGPALTITSTAIKALDNDEVVSLGELEGFVVDQISWDKLVPEEQALVSTLISATRKDIEAYLADKGIEEPSEEVVIAANVLKWIHDAAALRGVQ